MKWFKTESGVPFVCAGPDAFVFYLERRPGNFVIAWCGSKDYDTYRYVCCDKFPQRWCTCGNRKTGQWGAISTTLTEERAIGHTEELAVCMGAHSAGEVVSNHPPTHAQVSYARNLGITIPARANESGVKVIAVTTTELSDMITGKVATQQIDQLVNKVAGK
jgi:hypothetical protein